MATVEARPTALGLDPGKTALLVIDMQNDFGSVGGMFDRLGLELGGIAEAAEATKPVVQAAQEAGIPVVWIKMGHAPDYSDAGPEDGPHVIKHPLFGNGSTLVRDTWNTELLEGLTPEADDHVVWKYRYGAFFETELDDLLRSLGAKSLVFTGCTTSICVESSVRDAMFRDYSCLVLEDCTAEPLGTHASSLVVIERLFGWVSNSLAFEEALAALPAAGYGR